ncbi:MAG TPA: CvpA family protein [Verrucomicrobiales bacterium]|nr:CvpA family protein [Verrucomicrobiales bacterium]
MLIWIATLVIIGLCVLVGFFFGAIRMIIALTGAWIGMLSATKLAPAFSGLADKVGATYPVWNVMVSPGLAFITVALVTGIVGLIAGFPITRKIKFASNTVGFIKWAKMNRKLGACLGVPYGTIYILIIGVYINVPSYFTSQVVSDAESLPPLLKHLHNARESLESSDMTKVAAYFSPVSDEYYEMADMLGLLYNNPKYHTRLSSYPEFLDYEDRPEFQQIAQDSTLKSTLQSKSGIMDVLYNDSFAQILTNQELLQEFAQVDLEDLETFLRTGVSPKYEDQPILGRWKLEPFEMFKLTKASNKDITSHELLQAEETIAKTLAGLYFVAAPGNATTLRFKEPVGMQPILNRINAMKSDLDQVIEADKRRRNTIFRTPAAGSVNSGPSNRSRGGAGADFGGTGGGGRASRSSRTSGGDAYGGPSGPSASAYGQPAPPPAASASTPNFANSDMAGRYGLSMGDPAGEDAGQYPDNGTAGDPNYQNTQADGSQNQPNIPSAMGSVKLASGSWEENGYRYDIQWGNRNTIANDPSLRKLKIADGFDAVIKVNKELGKPFLYWRIGGKQLVFEKL